MRILALSLLALLATTFALLSNGAPLAAEPTDKEKSEMAAKVYALFKDKCVSCHGPKASAGWKRTIKDILNHEKLLSQGVINLEKPEDSHLYAELNDGDMPREVGEDGKAVAKKLPQADIDLVLSWIKAGAPKWEIPSPVAVALEGHKDKVTAVAFSPDGKSVLTGSWDNTARLWDAATGKEIRKVEQPEPVIGVAFSSDGKRLYTLCMNGVVTIWDSSSDKEIRKFEARCEINSSLAISADDKFLLTEDSDFVRLWDIETGKEVRTIGVHDPNTTPDLEVFIHSAVFSPDGKHVLVGGPGKIAHLWETESGKEVRKFEGHTDEIYATAFSPDGKYVFTGSQDKTARLWGADTGKEIRKFEGHTKLVSSLAFSPDGKYAVTTGDHTARVWDVATAKELNRFEHRFVEGNVKIYAAPTCAAFSPDGKRVVSCDSPGYVRIWAALPEKK